MGTVFLFPIFVSDKCIFSNVGVLSDIPLQRFWQETLRIVRGFQPHQESTPVASGQLDTGDAHWFFNMRQSYYRIAGSREMNEPKRIATIIDSIVANQQTAWARPLKQLRNQPLNVKEAAYEE